MSTEPTNGVEREPKVILYTEWGPLIRHDGKWLIVEDINPSWKAKWGLTRKQTFLMGWRLLRQSLTMKSAWR